MLALGAYYIWSRDTGGFLTKVNGTFLLAIFIHLIFLNPIPWRVPTDEIFQNGTWICSLEVTHTITLTAGQSAVNTAPIGYAPWVSDHVNSVKILIRSF
jgi:hypothetical protein